MSFPSRRSKPRNPILRRAMQCFLYPCVFLPLNMEHRFSAKSWHSAANKMEVGFWLNFWGGHCAESKVSFLGGVLSRVGGSILQWNLRPVQLCCVLEQMSLQARPPPRPSLVSWGWWNTSSAHSAPPCACAKETVSCNDMSALPHPVLSPTCAYCSTLIHNDDQDGIHKRLKSKKWTMNDRSSCTQKLEVSNTF